MTTFGHRIQQSKPASWVQPAGVLLLVVAIGAWGQLAPSSAAGSGPAPGMPVTTDCYRAALPDNPVWIFSEVWDRDALEPTLLLADNGRLSVERATPGKMEDVSLDAVKQQLRQFAGVPDSSIQGPSGLWLHGAEGYLIEFKHPWMLLQVDEDFEVLDDISPDPQSLDDDYGIYPPVLMAPLGDGFLGFGDVTEPSNKQREYNSAFVYFDREDHLQVFEDTKVSIYTEVRDRYLLNFLPYVATHDDVGFVLFFDAQQGIGRVEPGQTRIRRLAEFPEDIPPQAILERTPGVPGTRQAFLFYQQMETASFAAGIYTRGPDSLFLLVREALDGGKTAAWSIIRLNPHTGREIYRKRLPTTAAHLHVVPGEHSWALIEKAPVVPTTASLAPYMRVTSQVVIPAPWIEESQAGPLKPDLRAECGPLKEWSPRHPR